MILIRVSTGQARTNFQKLVCIGRGWGYIINVAMATRGFRAPIMAERLMFNKLTAYWNWACFVAGSIIRSDSLGGVKTLWVATFDSTCID